VAVKQQEARPARRRAVAFLDTTLPLQAVTCGRRLRPATSHSPGPVTVGTFAAGNTGKPAATARTATLFQNRDARRSRVGRELRNMRLEVISHTRLLVWRQG